MNDKQRERLINAMHRATAGITDSITAGEASFMVRGLGGLALFNELMFNLSQQHNYYMLLARAMQIAALADDGTLKTGIVEEANLFVDFAKQTAFPKVIDTVAEGLSIFFNVQHIMDPVIADAWAVHEFVMEEFYNSYGTYGLFKVLFSTKEYSTFLYVKLFRPIIAKLIVQPWYIALEPIIKYLKIIEHGRFQLIKTGDSILQQMTKATAWFFASPIIMPLVIPAKLAWTAFSYTVNFIGALSRTSRFIQQRRHKAQAAVKLPVPKFPSTPWGNLLRRLTSTDDAVVSKKDLSRMKFTIRSSQLNTKLHNMFDSFVQLFKWYPIPLGLTPEQLLTLTARVDHEKTMSKIRRAQSFMSMVLSAMFSALKTMGVEFMRALSNPKLLAEYGIYTALGAADVWAIHKITEALAIISELVPIHRQRAHINDISDAAWQDYLRGDITKFKEEWRQNALNEWDALFHGYAYVDKKMVEAKHRAKQAAQAAHAQRYISFAAAYTEALNILSPVHTNVKLAASYFMVHAQLVQQLEASELVYDLPMLDSLTDTLKQLNVVIYDKTKEIKELIELPTETHIAQEYFSDATFTHASVTAPDLLVQAQFDKSEKYILNGYSPCDYSKITSGYGPRLNPFTQVHEFHPGIDFAGGNCHAPVRSVVTGTVVAVTPNGSSGGYGNRVIIRSDTGPTKGLYFVYAHLADMVVRTGDNVVPGTLIGHVGSTGLSTGCHLHFEIRQYKSRDVWRTNAWRWKSNYTTVNPLLFLHKA